jgi:hypothetical protein
LNFIERFKDATIGFSGYPRLARDRAGGFGFMTLVLLIALAISCVISTVSMRRGLDVAVNQLSAAPDFALRSGQVEFKGQMPYVQKDGNSIFIVDTTGQTGSEALKGYSSGILVTKNKFYQIQSFGTIRETDLSTLPFSLDKSDVIGFMRALWIMVPIGYIFVYGFQLGCKALDACVLGLIGMLYGSATNRQVPFGLGFKLGLYAMTLPILMQWIIPGYTTIPSLSSPTHLLGFLVWWGVAILYLIMGLNAHFRTPVDETQGWIQ